MFLLHNQSRYMYCLLALSVAVRIIGEPYYPDVVNLQDFIYGSLSAAGWIIFMAGGILIAEIVAIVLVIFAAEPNWKMIIGILVS